MAKAHRDADRRAAFDLRERKRLLDEGGLAEAQRLNEDLLKRIAELQTVLLGSEPPQVSFAAMRRDFRPPAFDPGDLGRPFAAPEWERYAPAGPPSGIAARFGGLARYERELGLARQQYDEAVNGFRHAEEDRRRRLDAAHRQYVTWVEQNRAAVATHNAEIDAWETAFRAGDSDAVEDYFAHVLGSATYPDGFPDERRLAYRPEPRELWIEAELPTKTIVPEERGFRYVKVREQIDVLPRAEREIKQLYGATLAQTAIRILRDSFAADATGLVDAVVFNGHVSTRDPATGKAIRPCLVTVSANRSTFQELELAHLDPVACLRHLNAIVSPHPYDLVGVAPVVEFDLARYKFVDEIDAAASLDGRSDLLQMDPYRFEQLVRQLFEKIGLDSWVTQGSRDDGVDAVARNKDPILGGICVIQAKRYKNVVVAEAVRALWGTMEDKRATTGILVTTSWFGSAGRQFAANHRERLRLIEGNELKHLLAQHLGLDVRIGLERPPARWKR